MVTLYRLALVYPEALRAAWPKIKERLMDPDEDPSVTAAIVNVVCELGWRRPNDFLPLAPRLFDLLVDGGNNWMAIKLIKLVSTCTSVWKLYYVLIQAVREIDPPRTASRTKAIVAPNKHHVDHRVHVSSVRMYQRNHSGRHSRQWRGFRLR